MTIPVLSSRRRFLSHLTAAGVTAPLWAQKATPPAGLRVFTCGHSFHVWAAQIIADMAAGAGIADHQIAGISSIGGSKVI